MLCVCPGLQPAPLAGWPHCHRQVSDPCPCRSPVSARGHCHAATSSMSSLSGLPLQPVLRVGWCGVGRLPLARVGWVLRRGVYVPCLASPDRLRLASLACLGRLVPSYPLSASAGGGVRDRAGHPKPWAPGRVVSGLPSMGFSRCRASREGPAGEPVGNGADQGEPGPAGASRGAEREGPERGRKPPP